MAFEQLAPDRVPSSWTKWLDRGWHSIGVGDWLDGYVLPKLEADLLFLRQLVQSRGDFSRMNQRLEREVVGDLLRAQTHLPWTDKARAQFLVETLGDKHGMRMEREHALPVSQVISMVLMAASEGDMAMAKKRFTFSWLIPTVLCSATTHRSLPKTCDDFDRPYLRYSKSGELELTRIDGIRIDPATYTTMQLLSDLSAIAALRPIVDRLAGMTLPSNDQEAEFTRLMTARASRKT